MKTVLKGSLSKEVSALEKKNRALARKAAAEGFVLLENDGTLPLKEKKIALYGSGARMTVKGGTGSGAVRERYSVTIAEGLEAAGYEITTKNWLDRFDAFYADAYESYRQEQEKRVEGIREFYRILGMIPPFEHPTGIPVTGRDVEESACDTAVYVLARQAGEGNDREDKQGDYRLDDVERENLETVSKAYPNLVVVINAGGVIDVSFLDTLHVSALVYFVQGGEEGGNALADVLSGKVNFSGKLATSWAYRFEDLPSNTTYSYLGKDKYNQEYNEGIYVGYRFFDTFGAKPRYAFGYGLSYTAFALECRTAIVEKGAVKVCVNIRNTGRVSGREAVQLYASVPFGSGAEWQRLVAFAKTGELKPGETQEITLHVPMKELACYDESRAAWILRNGTYLLRLGNASDLNRPVAALTLREEAVLEQCENICPPRHAIEEIQPPKRQEEEVGGIPVLELDEYLPETVTHRYSVPEAEDPLADIMTARQLARLTVGAGTSAKNLQAEAMGASGSTTQKLYEELGIPNVILADGPAGLNLTSQVVELPDGSTKAARVPETLEAYKRYLFGFSRVALTSQMAEPSEGAVHYQYATAWPCSQLLAQTFDTKLMEEIGDCVGAEMEAFGVTVWLAPGMNIHRNPLCGRTFEYYSEDPLVSGKMAAAVVRGVQRHPGKGMSVKHFAANSCELERNMSSSNMTERTLRELYLKGFEIAVKESAPMTVMAAYNKINGVYCTNSYDLLVKVLRNEWGFEGLVMSDWDAMKAEREDCTKPASGDVQKAHAAQCDLVMPGREDQVEALLAGLESGAVKVEDLRRSGARILKMIRKNTVVGLGERR
ncbi:MAG: glycoside hydrolase family 3 C-terminal domain-containing protein [bacterium]|nr:glycoside hydrolase family 3 C-terminal domain-containing protein [bacterium]MCM1375796.1 glycoside hydrolase family 3 C-terminal domain-containing protein [Muribaculum sp.]